MSITIWHTCGHSTTDAIMRVGNQPVPKEYIEVSADKPCPKCQAK